MRGFGEAARRHVPPAETKSAAGSKQTVHGLNHDSDIKHISQLPQAALSM